jgi:hypothetical protein
MYNQRHEHKFIRSTDNMTCDESLKDCSMRETNEDASELAPAGSAMRK